MPGLPEPLYSSRWLLCLARLHEGKGQNTVLDVWRALPKEARAELSIFFVGQETQPGYRALLEKVIHALPDSDRLILAGPSETPHLWLQASDLFISGSAHEGMPLAPLEAAGLRFCGMSPDGVLPEIIELPGHPWFVGVQYHPELKSKPLDPHPLFSAFITAAVKQARLV